jgi:undecaprenyl-diphosphatase
MGLAAGISLARVYGGVHYPLDVVAGALLGVGLSGALFRSRMFRAASLRLARRIGGRFRL